MSTDQATPVRWFEMPDPREMMTAADLEYAQQKPARGRCAFCHGRTVHSQPCKELQYGWLVLKRGKHKGRHIHDVPHDYLRWMCKNLEFIEEPMLEEIGEIIGHETVVKLRRKAAS